PRVCPLFPYTTLFRSSLAILFLLPIAATILIPPAFWCALYPAAGKCVADVAFPVGMLVGQCDLAVERVSVGVFIGDQFSQRIALDRKSTRLNSSHVSI